MVILNEIIKPQDIRSWNRLEFIKRLAEKEFKEDEDLLKDPYRTIHRFIHIQSEDPTSYIMSQEMKRRDLCFFIYMLLLYKSEKLAIKYL